MSHWAIYLAELWCHNCQATWNRGSFLKTLDMKYIMKHCSCCSMKTTQKFREKSYGLEHRLALFSEVSYLSSVQSLHEKIYYNINDQFLRRFCHCVYARAVAQACTKSDEEKHRLCICSWRLKRRILHLIFWFFFPGCIFFH